MSKKTKNVDINEADVDSIDISEGPEAAGSVAEKPEAAIPRRDPEARAAMAREHWRKEAAAYEERTGEKVQVVPAWTEE